MLIPIRHENISARRWPLVTFALICINVAVFLFTFQPLRDQKKQLGQLKLHIILLPATHPDLNISSESQELIHTVQRQYSKDWAALQNRIGGALTPGTRPCSKTKTRNRFNRKWILSVSKFNKRNANPSLKILPSFLLHPKLLCYFTANFSTEAGYTC
jgi:hypothetical protein